MTRYITLAETLRIVEMNGWPVRDVALLDSVVARPAAHAFGTELYPSVHLKAAALMDSANRLHPLVDGNKRLSWLLADAFYWRNGYRIVADVDDAEAFVLQIADTHLELPEIAEWFAAHTHR